MTTEKNFVFFTNATSAKESNELSNFQSDELWLQVSGDATGLNAEVQIQANNGDEFVPCAVIDVSNLSVCNSISKNGIYVCSISGAGKIKVEIKSIGSGSVNIFSRSMH